MKHEMLKGKRFGFALLLIAAIVLAGCATTSKIQNTENGNANFDSLVNIGPTNAVELTAGERYSLAANPVKRQINGNTVFAYAYNDQSPGPVLKVKQGSSIYVDFKNNLPESTTVHWHGLRLENKFDGVPDITQKEVPPGGSFEYKLDFPDAGLFWYHPHVREDKQQEMGLYGTILVEPNTRQLAEMQEEILVLDDVLLEDGKLPRFEDKATNFAIMGRYGNTYFVNGKTDYVLPVQSGKPVRFYLLNASNVRPFRFAVENTKLKVIGGDAGLFEKQFWADNVTLWPSERMMVEFLPGKAGDYSLLNKTPGGTDKIGSVKASGSNAVFSGEEDFNKLIQNAIFEKELEKFGPFFEKAPDFEYELLIRWPVMDKMMSGQGHGGMMQIHGSEDGIEWEDEMRPINEITTNDEITWIIRDAKTKKENMNFYHSVKKGDIKKIRITNLENASHPMQHPIHLHGNRFLVLSEDGKINENLVWKDTVQIPAGKTVDLLVDFSNPGNWMIHCHIAEHLSSGMMSMIKVTDNGDYETG